jgi:hypothetical protein
MLMEGGAYTSMLMEGGAYTSRNFNEKTKVFLLQTV